MKKSILFFILLFSLLISGCSKAPSANTQPVQSVMSSSIEESVFEQPADELLENYVSNLSILETPTRQYGESTAYIELEGKLMARILYPEGGIAALNEAIEKWIIDTAEIYHHEADNVESGDSAELTAEYESYISDNTVSVKFTGLFDKPYLAHPTDVIATFNADSESGKMININDILSSDGDEILHGMVVEDAGIDQETADENLLNLWALTPEGLEIILRRGDYLPMSSGTVTLEYSYEELENILLTEEKIEEPIVLSEESEKEIPEITPSPSSQTISPDKPMVALTFDDGPSKHTDRLLDIFAKHGGKGTFFVIGNIIDKRTETVKRTVSEGHEIAGHSWDHRQLTNLSEEDIIDQIMNTKAKIYEVSGINSSVIRPPYGSQNDTVKRICSELGVVMVNWSLDTLDWKYKDSNTIYNTIMNTVKDGDIILCHDLHGTTVDAMELVIPALIEKGYQLVTVSELLSYSENEITAGNVYFRQ